MVVDAYATGELWSCNRIHEAFTTLAIVSVDLLHLMGNRFQSNACFTQVEVGAESTFISYSNDWSTASAANNVWMLHFNVCRFSEKGRP